jgi:hypothetical protein
VTANPPLPPLALLAACLGNGLPWIVKLMARAAQRYGIIVRDQSGVVTFYGEDPRPTGSNPYVGPGGYFSNEYPHRLVAKFPWGRLRALPHQLSCCWHPKT